MTVIIMNENDQKTIEQLKADLKEKDSIIRLHLCAALDIEKMMGCTTGELLRSTPKGEDVFGTKTVSCFSCGKTVKAGRNICPHCCDLVYDQASGLKGETFENLCNGFLCD